MKDHLGSIRAVTNANNTVIASYDYDAWGYLLREWKSGDDAEFKFTSKERDNETTYDYFGARYYDSRIGRWGGVEPKHDKYISLTPYSYVLNNALLFKDVDGMDIDFTAILIQSKDFANQVISELSTITGLNISMGEGNKLKIDGISSSENFSSSARDYLSNLINDESSTISVFANKNLGTQAFVELNEVNLNQTEIGGYKPSSDLNPLTMGAGMILLHELKHTKAGGGKKDPISKSGIGEVETDINEFREELGSNWGYRASYSSTSIGGKNYIGFSAQSQADINKRVVPRSSFVETPGKIKKDN